MNKRAKPQLRQDKENSSNLNTIKPLVSRVPLAPLSISKHASVFSNNLLSHYLLTRNLHDTSSCLTSHYITPSIRAHMVNWMIELCSSFGYSDCTFFATIKLLDAFLKKSAQSYSNSDILLTGVCCMIISSKILETNPLRIKNVCKILSKDSLSLSEIIRMEAIILNTLQYDLAMNNAYDVMISIATEVKAPEIVVHSAKIVLYLILHYYDSNTADCVTLAVSSLVVSASTLNMCEVYDRVVGLMNTSDKEILMIQMVYNAMLNFHKVFPKENAACKFLGFEFTDKEFGPLFKYSDKKLEDAQQKLIGK